MIEPPDDMGMLECPMPEPVPELLQTLELITLDDLSIESKKRIWDMAENVEKPNNFQSLLSLNDDPQLYAKYVTNDPQMVAYILRVVNSAMYGLRSKVTSVHHAVVYLGTNTVRSIIFKASSEQSFEAKTPEQHHAYQVYWFISIIASHLVQKLSNHYKIGNASTLSTEALLNSMGTISILMNCPDVAERYLENYGFIERTHFEQAQFGFNAMTVGSRIFHLWSLPDILSSDMQHLTEILLRPPDAHHQDEINQTLLLYLALRLSEYIVANNIEDVSDVRFEDLNPIDCFYLREYLEKYHINNINQVLHSQLIKQSTNDLIATLKPHVLKSEPDSEAQSG